MRVQRHAGVVPGNVRKSLLNAALRQTDGELQMPPDKKLLGRDHKLWPITTPAATCGSPT
jgi:hypothetical protein